MKNLVPNKLAVGLMLSLGALMLDVDTQAAALTGGDDRAAETKTEAGKDSTAQRRFEFFYGATVTGVPPGARVKIWVPLAKDNRFQQVEIKQMTLPVEGRIHTDPQYGNRILFLEMQAPGGGNIAFRISYDVVRSEGKTLGRLTESDRKNVELFLKPNAKVPVDGKPVEVFEKYRKEKGLELTDDRIRSGRVLYDFVEEHMAYDKSKPGYGNGDAVWACDSRTGNCTDFHSLFISVSRARGIPARFQIGFPLPEKRGAGRIGGYHCWAEFLDEKQGWVPVDISEADKAPGKKDYYFGHLSENRIQFTTGRDLILVPRQNSPPLNYFVYPHVEVDGKEINKDQVRLDFRYRDYPADSAK